MSEDISLSPNIQRVVATPKRRSLYDTIKHANLEVQEVSTEYIEKCKLEMETHESIIKSTKDLLRELREKRQKKTIVADLNCLDQKQKNFLKKSSDYLELVEDLCTHLVIKAGLSRKFHLMCSFSNKVLKQLKKT